MSDDLYKTLLESTNAIPWKIDWATQTFAYIGPQIEQLLGWAPESWKTVDDWVARMHPDDRQRVVGYCVAQSKAGLDHEADYRAAAPNGTYRWIRDVVHVVRDDTGTVALIGFMFAISEIERDAATRRDARSPIRVHIADDHPVVRQGLTNTLTAAGDIVVVGDSADGESAVRAAEAGGFDILVLDLTLPGISGFDVLARVRATCPMVKVLILSMHTERHYALRVLRSGAHGYLAKECQPDTVLEAIRVIAQGNTYIPPNVAASLLGTEANGPPHTTLSERELAVLIAIGRGNTPSEIAAMHDVSNSTVSTHIARIRAKLNARSIGDLVRYAVKTGLVE